MEKVPQLLSMTVWLRRHRARGAGRRNRGAGDEAESIGLFALQKWNEIGLKPLNVLPVGATYSF